MPIPTNLGYLGVGKETVKGTGVVPTAFVPVVQGRTMVDTVTMIDDEGMRGSMVDGAFDQILGALFAEVNVPDSPVFADTLPWFVAGLLGDVSTTLTRSTADGVTTSASTTVTSATAAFTAADVGRGITAGANLPAGTYIVVVTNATTVTVSQPATATGSTLALKIADTGVIQHICSLKNSGDAQCTSMSLTDFYGASGGTPARRMAGGQVAEVGLKFNADGLFMFSSRIVGLQTTNVAKPSQSFTTVTPDAGWQCPIIIGGTALATLMSLDMTIRRNVTPIQTADGTQAPYKIWQGPLSVDGKMTLVAEDDSEYLRYLNNTKPSIEMPFFHGSGTTGVGTTIRMSKTNYTGAAPNHTGDFMVWEADIKGLPNTIDAGSSGGYSPVQVRFNNSVAAGSYQ